MKKTPFQIKEKKCRVCKKKFQPFNSLQVTCGAECAVKAAKERPDVIADAEKKITKAWLTETKEKHRTHSDYENWLQVEINTIVRLIDRDHVCISCQRPPKKINAGHYHAVNANNPLRFHLLNNFLQDEYCNTYLSANKTGYNAGLIETFGKEFQEWLEYKLPLIYPSNKLSIPELQSAIVICRRIVKELKKADRTYSTEERLELRRKYNLEIGIYLEKD